MDFSEAAKAHAEAEAERKSSAWVRLPVDVPPYGLSAELLLSSAWITRHLTLIEPGSLVVGACGRAPRGARAAPKGTVRTVRSLEKTT